MKSARRKVMCLVVNVDRFLISHFKEYTRTLIADGIELHVLTADTGRIDEIRSWGACVSTIPFTQGYGNLLNEIIVVAKLFLYLHRVRPDIVECITIKPVLFGGIVGRLLGIPKIVLYISGLGFAFTRETAIGRMRALVVRNLYRVIFSSGNVEVVVENRDDGAMLHNGCGVPMQRLHLIPGAGIDLSEFIPRERRKSTNIRVLMVSRLLRDKGVMEFIAASEQLSHKYPNVDFVLVGDCDLGNPMSLTDEDVNSISRLSKVIVLGHRADICRIMQDSDVFVLPSYREGFPRVLMESAASGLPSVTTNVPGCRDATIDGITGILVDQRNAEQLAEALAALIEDDGLRKRLGANARQHAEQNFGLEQILSRHVSILGLSVSH